MFHQKQIFEPNDLKSLLNEQNSCVSLVKNTRLLALPPFFLNDMKSGILYQLNSMLKKYDRSLDGIVIGYRNIKVLMDENTGNIPMGTSETEVNISAEFYIFQPKIGNYLKGIINKKSNTHIGCLVHQYFNASILKPEDVFYEDWICKDLNVDDKINFKVIDLDFTTLLPYIEGCYEGKTSSARVKSRTKKNCDIDNVITNKSDESSEMEQSFSDDSERESRNMSEDDFLKVEKNKKKNKKDMNLSNDSEDNCFEEDQSFAVMETKKKKKKKKKKEKKLKISATADNEVEECEEKHLNEVTSEANTEELELDEIPKKKKKKKNKEKNKTDIDVVEDENSNDIKPSKKKKKMKKDKRQNEDLDPDFNKTSECLPPQEIDDNVLYSTQLEPVLGLNKMRMSFCSPIPRNSSFENKEDVKSTVSKSPLQVNSEDNSDEIQMEVTGKPKKRKREKVEELENSPAAKKLKTSPSEVEEHTSEVEDHTIEVEDHQQKSLMQRMMEEICKKQLSRVKEELNASSSDRDSFAEEKKEKTVEKKKMEQNEPLKINENTKPPVNGDDSDSDIECVFEKICDPDLQIVKEELNLSDIERVKEKNKKRKKVVKQKNPVILNKNKKKRTVHLGKNSSAQVNGTNKSKNERNSQRLVKKLQQEEVIVTMERINLSDTESLKGKKKKKPPINKLEPSKKETTEEDSLYDKLLNQAKCAVDLEKDSPSKESGEKKKDSELSDMSGSHFKKKNSKKKSKVKEMTEDSPVKSEKSKVKEIAEDSPVKSEKSKVKEITEDSPVKSEKSKVKEMTEDSPVKSEKCKNGSVNQETDTEEMETPEPILSDDSEKKSPSPGKKTEKANETGISALRNLMDEFSEEKMKRSKSKSDKESLKSTEKKERKRSFVEQKSEKSSEKEESLYEKLLKDAKSMIGVLEEPPDTKKKKKKGGEGKKK